MYSPHRWWIKSHKLPRQFLVSTVSMITEQQRTGSVRASYSPCRDQSMMTDSLPNTHLIKTARNWKTISEQWKVCYLKNKYQCCGHFLQETHRIPQWPTTAAKKYYYIMFHIIFHQYCCGIEMWNFTYNWTKLKSWLNCEVHL